MSGLYSVYRSTGLQQIKYYAWITVKTMTLFVKSAAWRYTITHVYLASVLSKHAAYRKLARAALCRPTL